MNRTGYACMFLQQQVGQLWDNTREYKFLYRTLYAKFIGREMPVCTKECMLSNYNKYIGGEHLIMLEIHYVRNTKSTAGNTM